MLVGLTVHLSTRFVMSMQPCSRKRVIDQIGVAAVVIASLPGSGWYRERRTENKFQVRFELPRVLRVIVIYSV